MSLPLGAQGEFARIIPLLESALGNPGGSLVMGSAAEVGDHDVYAMLADVAAQQRNGDALRRYAPHAAETAARTGHTLYEAMAHRALGVAHLLDGAHAESEARLQRALVLFEQLDTRWQLGRTLQVLGELAQAQAQPDAARRQYERAASLYAELRATPDLLAVRGAIQTLDV